MMFWHVARVSRQLGELESEVKVLVRDSQTMVQNINNLTNQARVQMEEMDKVVKTVGAWSERANRIVDEFSNVVETPILTATRFITAMHKALGGFLELFPRKDQPDTRRRDKD
jgi:uncharacterized protein YoxC